MSESLTFIASLLFLIGVLMVMASVVPQLKERIPGLMGYGFLVSVLGIVMAVVAAFMGNGAGN